MKKIWANPLLHANNLSEGDDSWIGPGSGQGTPDDGVMFTYDEWLEIFAEDPLVMDFDGDGTPGTLDDYYDWYLEEFGEDIRP